jgi:hypothetical protein
MHDELAACWLGRGSPATSNIDRTLDNWLEVLDHSPRRRWNRRVQVMEKSGG